MRRQTRYRFALAVAVAAMGLLAAPAAAAAHALTLHNGLAVELTTLTLRDGAVTGFEGLKPGRSVTVGVSRDNGACGGWLVMRTRRGDTANALIDLCAGGAYVVTAGPRRGTPVPSLTVVPID